MCISNTSIQQLTLHKQYFPQNFFLFIPELDHKLSPRTCVSVAMYSALGKKNKQTMTNS